MTDALRAILGSRRLRAAALGIFFMGALAASLSPYYGLIAITVFGFSDRAFAILMVVGAFNSVVVSLYLGVLTDQWASRHTTALLCTTISVAGLAAVWITRSPWVFIVSATITNPIGFSVMGQLYAIARLAVTDHAPAIRDGVMSMIRAGFALPFIVILPLWSVAFSRDVSLIHIFAATALAAFGTLCAIALLMPKDGVEGVAELKSGLSLRAAFAELLHPRVSARLVLIATLVAANTIYMATMGLIFEAAHPQGAARTARFAALVAGLEIPFMLMIPWFTARLSKAQLLLIAIVIYATFLVSFPNLADREAVWLLAIPAAAGAAVLLTMPIAYFQDLLSDRPGAGSSLQSVNQVTSQLIAGAVFWVGTSLATYGLVMWIGAGLAICAGVVLWLLDR